MGAIRNDIPMYRAWLQDHEGEADAKKLGAIDVAFAAEIRAQRFHDHEEGEGCHWPLTVIVIDPDGKKFAVVVQRVMSPTFEADTPTEIK